MSMLCEGDDIYTNVLCVTTLWRRKEQELLYAIISDEVRALGISFIRTPFTKVMYSAASLRLR